MKPLMQSVYVCDKVEPAEGGKVTFKGIFNVIEVAPGTDFNSPFVIVFNLSNIHGECQMVLSYTDLSDDTALRELPVRASGEPGEVVMVVLNSRLMPVPHPGTFVWELVCEGEPIGSCRIHAFHTA